MSNDKNSNRVSSKLELTNVSRKFGAVIALDGLNLTVEPGELVALLGPSGCGKTTALRIVAGLESADSGSLKVNGVSYLAKPANERDMGMVFQSYSLFPKYVGVIFSGWYSLFTNMLKLCQHNVF